MVSGMNRNTHSRGGFTLIELLVVIAIITILTTIVGINVLNKPAEAKIAATKSNISALKSALQIYKTDNGFYPTQPQGLQALVAKAAADPVPASFPTDGYLTSRNVPKDAWNRDLIYLAPGRKGESYEIISYGSDGEPGGKGDAADLSSSDL
jgi:general secretion pathway protein G